MTKTKLVAHAKRTALSVGGAILIAATLAGYGTAGERHGDRHRCSGYGHRHYDDCMYKQQYRRDREQLMNQEKALINAAQARENLRMLREIRRRRGEY